MQPDLNSLPSVGVYLKSLSNPPARHGSSRPGTVWFAVLGFLEQPHLEPAQGVGCYPEEAIEQALIDVARRKRDVTRAAAARRATHELYGYHALEGGDPL